MSGIDLVVDGRACAAVLCDWLSGKAISSQNESSAVQKSWNITTEGLLGKDQVLVSFNYSDDSWAVAVVCELFEEICQRRYIAYFFGADPNPYLAYMINDGVIREVGLDPLDFGESSICTVISFGTVLSCKDLLPLVTTAVS